MIVEILKGLSYNRITKIGFITFGTVIAPFMFIFQFAVHIFNQTALVPLLFLSFCIGLPITLLILALQIWDYAGLDAADPKEKLEDRFRQMASSAIITGTGFYLPCIIKFFYPGLQMREAFGYMAAFFFSIVLSSLLSISRGGAKRLHDAMQKEFKKEDDKKKDA